VLNIVRRLVEERGSVTRSRWGEATDEPAREDARPTKTFTTTDTYTSERELEKLHPDNRHVKDKIRQQLQILPPSSYFRLRVAPTRRVGATRRYAVTSLAGAGPSGQ
jgi:hypothetical protein